MQDLILPTEATTSMAEECSWPYMEQLNRPEAAVIGSNYGLNIKAH